MSPFNSPSFKFQPTSIQELCNIAYRASYLEVSSEPKPGNVSPHQAIGKAHYEDFLQSIQAIHQFNLTYFTQKPLINSFGDYIIGAVEKMITAQQAGNVLLGHILLFTPLLFGSQKCITEHQKPSWELFWEIVDRLIQESTPDDGVKLYRAIQLANPGGLKNPGGVQFHPKYDFTLPNIEKEIRRDNRTLRDLFHESAEFDVISQEYLENFQFSRFIFLDWAVPQYSTYHSMNDFVIDLFLQILGSHYDSLIYRKNTLEIANSITEKAKIILNHGGIRSTDGKRMILELNTELKNGQGKLNPGTSADLTACVLFIGMLFGTFQNENKK